MSASPTTASHGVAVNVHIHIAGATPSEQIVEIAAPSGSAWEESWHPTSTLDGWCALRKVGECIEIELEVSRASFVPGRQARAWIPNATVSVAAGPGWSLVQDIHRPWPTVWPIKRGAWRRFALYPSGRPNLRVQASSLVQGSLANPNFASWGPANMPLGALSPALTASLESKWNANYAGLRSALLTGNTSGWYAEDSEDNPRSKPGGWIVWGPDDPGQVGGSGVYFSTGWQRNQSFARYALLACQPLHERMWLAYNKTTGEPITVDDYGPVSPNYSPGTHDSNNNDLPENRGVANQDALPDPYDTSHRIRHDRYCVAAHELTGSPMARRMVKHAAAQVRLQWSERGAPAAYGYTPINLSNAFKAAQANPHQGWFGTNGGRSIGEPAFVIAAAKKFGATDGDAWAKMLLDLVNLACTPHGVLQRQWDPQPTDGSVDVWYGGANDMAHSFEVPMLGLPVVAIARQFGLPIPAQVALSLKSVFCNPALLRPYYSNNVGPWDYLYVGAHGGSAYNQIPGGQTTPGSPEGDATHAELACALGYSVTGDPAFLNALAHVGLPAADWHAKLAQLQAASGLDWNAFSLGQLQVAMAHAQPA